MGAMIRLTLLLSAVVIIGCGGAGLDASPTPTQPLDLDEATTRLWSSWAETAQQIASATEEQYRSATLTLALAREDQQRAQALSEEIRNAETADELVLKLADDLDALVGALDFGLEIAKNVGITVIDIAIPTLEDAYAELALDANALSEMLQAR